MGFVDLDVTPGENTFGAVEETEELRILVDLFDKIVDAYNDIVASRSLPT